MNKIKSLIIFLAIMMIGATVHAGTVTEVSGDVDILSSGSWKSAYVGMSISDGAKIMTGLDSKMKVDTTGGMYIVEELSMVTFNETTTETSSSQNLDLELGSVDVEFSRGTGLSLSFSVSTPKGTASIRGTRERVIYFPTSGMTVQVLLGEIDVSDLVGNRLPANKGQSVVVGANGGLSTDVDDIYGFFGLSGEYLDDDTTSELMNQLVSLFDPFTGLLNRIGEPERL